MSHSKTILILFFGWKLKKLWKTFLMVLQYENSTELAAEWAMHVSKVFHICLLSRVIFQKYILSFTKKKLLNIANNIFTK